MKSRIRKLISLVLAASMIFTMNTAAFAGEIPEDGQGTAVEESAEVAACTGEAAPEEAADDEAAVDSTDGSVDEGGGNDGLNDGILYDRDGKPVTAVTYVTDKTDKKATEPNVATITNTTDPISWNNNYAQWAIATVLEGNDNRDTYLNHSAPIVVSQDELPEDKHPVGYRSPRGLNFSYRVIPIVKGQSYLFIGYGFGIGYGTGDDDTSFALHVAGYDGLENDEMNHGIQQQDMARIPVTEWDERKIEYNKSGKHKYTRSKREILDVEASIVTYSNGTVTEVPGVEVGNVKIDKKALKTASVALDYSLVENKGIIAGRKNGNEVKYEAKTRMEYYGNNPAQSNYIFAREYAAIGKTMPSFTMSVKLKGDEAKAYKKDVDKILKDKAQTFYFGVQQCCVRLNGSAPYSGFFVNKISFKVDPETGAKTYTISSESVAEKLAEEFSQKGYNYRIDNEEETFIQNKFKISRFSEKDGKATIKVIGAVGEDKKDSPRIMTDTYEEIATLKPGKDYNLVDGSIAGTKVKVLEFAKNGNYAYKPMDHRMVGKAGADGKVTWTLSEAYYEYGEEDEWEDAGGQYDGSGREYIPVSDLSGFGYKWAFRESPVDSKYVRYGLYKDTDEGFVYSRD